MNLTKDTEIVGYSCLNYCTSNKISIKNLCPFIVGKENSNSNLLKILYFLEVRVSNSIIFSRPKLILTHRMIRIKRRVCSLNFRNICH
jgi:hypothetical protein